jgi:hypothetical protein
MPPRCKLQIDEHAELTKGELLKHIRQFNYLAA